MTKGKAIESGADAPIEQSQTACHLRKIPVGTQIYAIEINPGKGAQMVRSAGTKAQLMAKEGDYARSSCRVAKYVVPFGSNCSYRCCW
jgi:large subunit ribosomal protein L2